MLLSLVGSDLVAFNRAFAATPLGGRVLRLCGALEENGLLGAGGDDTGELYAAMGYFAAVATERQLDFAERYAARFGPHAPVLNGHGEGCYDGVRLLAALAERAGSLAVPARGRGRRTARTVTRRPRPVRAARPARGAAGLSGPGGRPGLRRDRRTV